MKFVMTRKQLQTILNIASDLVSKLSSASNIFFLLGQNFLDILQFKKPLNYTFHIKEINEDFVFKELRRLSVSKSTGLDG